MFPPCDIPESFFSGFSCKLYHQERKIARNLSDFLKEHRSVGAVSFTVFCKKRNNEVLVVPELCRETIFSHSFLEAICSGRIGNPAEEQIAEVAVLELGVCIAEDLITGGVDMFAELQKFLFGVIGEREAEGYFAAENLGITSVIVEIESSHCGILRDRE